MRVHHRTDAADAILAHGFKDHCGTYGLDLDEPICGVFLSNKPLDMHEGAKGDELLALEVDEQIISDHEWAEDGKPYREWCVPAGILNTVASVRIANEADLVDEVRMPI